MPSGSARAVLVAGGVLGPPPRHPPAPLRLRAARTGDPTSSSGRSPRPTSIAFMGGCLGRVLITTGPSHWDRIEGMEGEQATFGAGCYWGTEKFFRKDFEKLHPGAIKATAVGFMGPEGSKINPTYEEVCTGRTGHVEVLHIRFDPKAARYEDLVRFFFTFHDPTTPNRQGNDRGPQYASVIFTHSDEQREVAERVVRSVDTRVQQKSLVFASRPFAGDSVTTAVLPATKFYPANEDHQQYLEKNPSGYCNHGIRFTWDAQKGGELKL